MQTPSSDPNNLPAQWESPERAGAYPDPTLRRAMPADTIYPHPQDPTVGYVKHSRKIKDKVVTGRTEVAIPCEHMTGPFVGVCPTTHRHRSGSAHECRYLCEEYLAAVELMKAKQ